MKWFGQSWGAPICSYGEHVATPVGVPCLRCTIPIQLTDAGFITPYLPEVGAAWSEAPWHRECFLESILGEQSFARYAGNPDKERLQ